MIELLVYEKPTDKRFLNFSAFCAKTEAFLRFNKIDHKVTIFNGNPAKFKKAKLPVIQDEGKYICDSHFIEEYLTKKFNINTDDHLTDLDKANGFAYAKLCEEFLYWSILHERWFIDENWEKLKEKFFAEIPKFMRGVVSNMIRKGMRKSTYGHGMGRHSDEEVHTMGMKSIGAISVFLGDKKFLLGDKASSFDMTIHSFVSNAIYCDLNPKIKKECEQYKNLLSYSERVLNLL